MTAVSVFPLVIYVDLLKYWLFTAVPCSNSNTVSPTPKKLSVTERMVGSDILEVSGLTMAREDGPDTEKEDSHVKPLERLTPANTVDNRTASNV